MHAHGSAVQKSGRRADRADRPGATIDAAKTGSNEARAEIYTYVAIRDLLLRDAEVTTTTESLRRATIANEFVENCLQPPRSPYEGQCLRQMEAAREHQHCLEARNRIAQLARKLEVA